MPSLVTRINTLQEERLTLLQKRYAGCETNYHYADNDRLAQIDTALAELWNKRRCEMQHCQEKAAPLNAKTRAELGNQKARKVLTKH